jgi:hypothetical protein
MSEDYPTEFDMYSQNNCVTEILLETHINGIRREELTAQSIRQEHANLIIPCQ